MVASIQNKSMRMSRLWIYIVEVVVNVEEDTSIVQLVGLCSAQNVKI